MSKLPSSMCFRTDEEQADAEYATFDDYIEANYGPKYIEEGNEERERLEADYDFDRSNYKYVSEFTAAEQDGWDYVPYRKRVIQRISDSKYFMLTEHIESWDIGASILPGEYGDISEAKPVQVQTFERV